MVAVVLRVLLTVILLTVCTALVWPRPGHPGRGVRDDRHPAGVRPLQDAWPESVEGVLVRQLSTGEIARSQYLQAMACIAGRDAARHPRQVFR
jgi:hypothetical protein